MAALEEFQDFSEKISSDNMREKLNIIGEEDIPQSGSAIPVFRPQSESQMAMAPQSGQMPVAQQPRPQLPVTQPSRQMPVAQPPPESQMAMAPQQMPVGPQREEEAISGFSKMLRAVAPELIETLYKKSGGDPEKLAEEIKGTSSYPNDKNIWPGFIRNFARDAQGLPPSTDSRGGLIEMAMGGDFRGRVPGDGHGMEDNVFMPIQEGPEQVGTLAVSPKEYVVDAHTMSALGNGNADKGADVMDKVVENVRHQAYGTIKQPREINGLAALRPMTERV